jgi:hypothetical protein
MNYKRTSRVETFAARIYASGPIDIIKQACREYCKSESLCVNVSETLFIYKGGEEFGACVELINYPKFPIPNREILHKATELASNIKDSACQDSILIMTPDDTYWYSDREREFTLNDVKEIIDNKYKNEET